MSDDLTDDALADRIVRFLKESFNDDVRIEHADGGGFAIWTDVGASFEFEIARGTRAEVALAYFEHLRKTARFIVENRRTGALIDCGRRITRKEKEAARARLAKLDEWAACNLS